MPSKNPSQRLRDITENIEAIEGFITGMDFQRFAADRKTVYAVVRALEIISEASRRLPEELKQRHPGSGLGSRGCRQAMCIGMSTRRLMRANCGKLRQPNYSDFVK